MVEWGIVQASKAAHRTVNPIRQIVDRLKVPPNPAKPLISLGLGDPTVYGNLDTHPAIAEVISRAVLAGRSNGYLPVSGCDTARAAVAARYSSPEAPLAAGDVTITSGCSGALELMFAALADEGDTILLPQPGFTLYKTLCDSKGIVPAFYALDPLANWEVDLARLRQQLLTRPAHSRVAAWLINNPSNPCGSVYSEAHLRACLALAEEFKIPIIADEIYEDMVFEGHRFVPLRTLPGSVPVLTCGGMAKRWLVPGWRVGWILLSDRTGALGAVREGLGRLAGILLGANSLVQASLPAIFAASPDSFYTDTNSYLQANAEIAATALHGLPGISYVKPQGAMYMMVGFDLALFPGFSDDIALSEALIAEESVVCLPGTIFGMPNYLRIVVCGETDRVAEACARLREFCLRHLATTACAN